MLPWPRWLPRKLGVAAQAGSCVRGKRSSGTEGKRQREGGGQPCLPGHVAVCGPAPALARCAPEFPKNGSCGRLEKNRQNRPTCFLPQYTHLKIPRNGARKPCPSQRSPPAPYHQLCWVGAPKVCDRLLRRSDFQDRYPKLLRRLGRATWPYEPIPTAWRALLCAPRK